MYTSVCYVSYSVVVMFTCTLVRSTQRAGEIKLKLGHHRVERGNKMHACKKGPEPGSVYTQSEAMKDILARCHKKTDVQVCTLTIVYYCPVTVNICALATYVTFL
jgi:hypothetical protein